MKIDEKALKRLIKTKGFKQIEFAKRLRLTRQGLYYLMMRPSVKQDHIEEICTVLNVKQEEFLIPQNVKENVTRETNGMSELEKEVLRLRESVADKNRLIAAQEKVMKMQEHLIGTLNKKVASIVHPKSRHS